MWSFFLESSRSLRGIDLKRGFVLLLTIGTGSFGAVHAACGGGDDPDQGTNLTPNDGGGGDEALPTIASRPEVCDPAVPLPTELRCTGLYADFAAKTIAPEAREFAPAFPLWSDGATKRRFLLLPAGSKIDTADMDEWIFPIGTKVWKEFSVNGKLVETRLFTKTTATSWAYTTYVWSADSANATRLDSGQTNVVGSYEIPSTVHCSQCHNGHADRLLGVDAISLGLPNATGVTLATLTGEGRLTVPPAKTTFALPGTQAAQNALGYVHINCGVTCHSPGGNGTSQFTGLHMRLSAKALITGTTTVNDTNLYKTAVGDGGVPIATANYQDDPRFAGYKRVTPKNPDKSLIFAVVSLRGEGQMPPIISHELDKNGAQFLRDWITGL